MEELELEIIGCPECDAPAEVETWSGPATGAQVEHVRVRCVRRHWFLLPRELLAVSSATARAQLSEG